MSRIMHICLDIRGAIQGTGWKAVAFSDGRKVPKAQAIEWLMDRLAEGKRVLPIGGPCEGFDFQKGCPGHEEPEATSGDQSPTTNLEDASRSPVAAPPTVVANNPLPTPVETSQTPSLVARASASEQHRRESGGPFDLAAAGTGESLAGVALATSGPAVAEPFEGFEKLEVTHALTSDPPREGPTNQTPAVGTHTREPNLETEASHALVQRAGHSVAHEAPVAAAPAHKQAAAAPKRLSILTVNADGTETPIEVEGP